MKQLMKPLLTKRINTVEMGYLIIAFSPIYTSAVKNGFPNGLSLKEFAAGVEKNLTFTAGPIAQAGVSYNAEKVSLSGGTVKPLFYSLTETGYDRELPKREIKQEIEVSRVFDDRDGGKVIKVKAGDEINVKLRLRATKKGTIPYLVMIDLFPAGFELIRESVEGPADFIDKREDRLVVYTNANGESMQEIKYKLKATHKGKFTVPPAFAESLYDKDVKYRGVANTIEVQ
jgi:uncharacterized protein YfaS (alpha-2-macroglobulin family)